MKRITKKQFLEHGWKKGDKVRTERGLESVFVVSLRSGGIWTGRRAIYWSDIIEILPTKPKKGRMK